MRYFLRASFTVLISIALLSLKCEREEDGNGYFGHWLHSFEDDRPEYTAYRPANYDFPPSRGREGFKISSNGDFERYKIGATDQIRVIKGSWKRKNKMTILVSYENENPPYEKFEILEVTDFFLKVKKD